MLSFSIPENIIHLLNESFYGGYCKDELFHKEKIYTQSFISLCQISSLLNCWKAPFVLKFERDHPLVRHHGLS